jgi:hypothetical protein
MITPITLPKAIDPTIRNVAQAFYDFAHRGNMLAYATAFGPRKI